MSRKVILLVEDDTNLLEVTSYLLEGAGYEVHRASNGEDALLALTRTSADLILMDYMMPGMDGGELIRIIRARELWDHVPVLVLSALSEESVRERCGTVSGFLRKPFMIEDLLRTVRRLLNGFDNGARGREDPPAAKRPEVS